MTNLRNAMLDYANAAPEDENAVPPMAAVWGWPSKDQWANKPVLTFLVQFEPSLFDAGFDISTIEPQDLCGSMVVAPYYQLCGTANPEEAEQYMEENNVSSVLYVTLDSYGSPVPEAPFDDAFEIPPLSINITSATEVAKGKWCVYAKGTAATNTKRFTAIP